MNIFLSHFVQAQTMDSLYFSLLKNTKLMNSWTRAPYLKENNTPILCELCELISEDPCEDFIAILILDTIGNPVCIKIFPEILSEFSKIKIVNLLYQLKFDPAIGNQKPVISHYLLVINSKKCKMYKNMNKQKGIENCDIKEILKVTAENNDSYYMQVKFSHCASKRLREDLIKEELRSRFPLIGNRTVYVSEYLGKMYNEYKYEIKVE